MSNWTKREIVRQPNGTFSVIECGKQVANYPTKQQALNDNSRWLMSCVESDLKGRAAREPTKGKV